jgi:hypothetical protein
VAHFLFLVRFVGQTIIDPEQNRTKSHEKVFVVILNRVPDNQECHDFLNSDGLGFIVEESESDNGDDGIRYQDHSDIDDANDGISDDSEDSEVEVVTLNDQELMLQRPNDFDGDDIPDCVDNDDDNDGIPDKADYDDDNDGIPDDQEDEDLDGILDIFDNDDDNDGIPDKQECHDSLNETELFDMRRAALCPRIKKTLDCESILTTIKTKSDMFEKFKSIQWFDFAKHEKRAILKQFKKQRKFQVHFYENGITFQTDDGIENTIRTSPFPILNLY